MTRRLLVGLAALAMAAPAYAEVADKVPSTGALWVAAIAFNLVALGLERVRPYLGLVVVPLAAFYAVGGHIELASLDVGPAIVQELGPSYVTTSYVAFALGLFGPLLLVFLRRRPRRR